MLRNLLSFCHQFLLSIWNLEIFYMGNCTNDFIERKTARKSFDFTNSKSAKAPLVFQIKTWPHMQNFDLQDTQNCLQRSIDASLYEGEMIEINLKSSPQVNGSAQSLATRMNYTLRCYISKKDKCYTIKFPSDQERNYLWKFIGNWTGMEEGDVIRMGKTKYRLCKLVHEIQTTPYKSLKNIDESLMQSNKGIDDETRCRICLSSVQTQQNPFISPCKCTGSVKYTHLKCLSNWLFDLNMEQNSYIKIRINKSICQLCKTDIAGTPEYERMTDLLLGNANNIPPPYAIFQVYQKQQARDKNYFILSFSAKQSYTFGRSSKADICDTHDKCISKFNTELLYRGRKLKVKDCESMHGTFMKVRDQLNLYESNLIENIAYRNMIIKARYIPMFESA